MRESKNPSVVKCRIYHIFHHASYLWVFEYVDEWIDNSRTQFHAKKRDHVWPSTRIYVSNSDQFDKIHPTKRSPAKHKTQCHEQYLSMATHLPNGHLFLIVIVCLTMLRKNMYSLGRGKFCIFILWVLFLIIEK